MTMAGDIVLCAGGCQRVGMQQPGYNGWACDPCRTLFDLDASTQDIIDAIHAPVEQNVSFAGGDIYFNGERVGRATGVTLERSLDREATAYVETITQTFELIGVAAERVGRELLSWFSPMWRERRQQERRRVAAMQQWARRKGRKK